MKNKYVLVLLLACLIIPVLDLLHSGFPVTHDGQDHIARIANFYQNLKEGIIIPRWAENLNWGYGHPILMFLYPLSSYFASFFHFIGFSLIDSTKLTFALGVILSGITMYIWLSSFWGRTSSFLGSVLYVFAPYRFVDVYVRGDIGENLAFVFVPLVLFFIHKLAKNLSLTSILGASFSFALLILSHNAISLMFLPFILFYIGYEAIFKVKKRKEFLFRCAAFLVLGFCLSAFFWIPGLIEGQYTLRNIVTVGQYKDRFVTIPQLIYGKWDYGGSGIFTVQLGILQWIFFILSLCLLPFIWLKKRKKIPFIILVILYTIVPIAFMLPITQFFWDRIMLLQNFQFPWRFLAVPVFTTAILGSFILEIFPKNMQKMVVCICVIVILFISKDYWHAKAYKVLPDSFFTGIYNSTTDTGESSPIWSVRFMEKHSKFPLEIATGQGQVVAKKRTGTQHIYVLSVASNQVKVVENTLYFPGWHVFVDNKEVPVEFQDQLHRGLMEFLVPHGVHEILISFRETKLRFISDIISLVSIIFSLILLVRVKKVFK